MKTYGIHITLVDSPVPDFISDGKRMSVTEFSVRPFQMTLRRNINDNVSRNWDSELLVMAIMPALK